MANNYTSCSVAWPVTNHTGIEKLLDLFRDWCEDVITLDALVEMGKIDIPDIWEEESERVAEFKECLIYTVNTFRLEKNVSESEGRKFLPYGDLTKEGGYILRFATENLDIEAFAFVAQALVSLEPKGTEWILSYADTCDKLRIDEFGGGVIVVNKEQTEIWDAVSLFKAYRLLRDGKAPAVIPRTESREKYEELYGRDAAKALEEKDVLIAQQKSTLDELTANKDINHGW